MPELFWKSCISVIFSRLSFSKEYYLSYMICFTKIYSSYK